VPELPFVDEHAATVDAPAAEAWRSLLDLVDGLVPGPGAVYARVVGCEDTVASGPRPLTEGSTIPGFHVVRAVPERELALEGRHRFSTYALTFRLEGGPSGTTVRAETRAAFPGVLGQAYRTAVIRSGAHALLMRRLLAAVRRRAALAIPPRPNRAVCAGG
jgi:hypothetical protein